MVENTDIIVNDDTFHVAMNTADYFSRRRLVKKLDKRVYPRNGAYVGKEKAVTSPLTGLPLVVKSGQVVREPRAPKDLEPYFERFVRHWYGKALEKA